MTKISFVGYKFIRDDIQHKPTVTKSALTR